MRILIKGKQHEIFQLVRAARARSYYRCRQLPRSAVLARVFRQAAPSLIHQPFFSQNGALSVDLSYNTTKDADGRTLYCFTTPDGTESPTLHVRPGDHLIVHVTNNLPAASTAGAMQMATNAATQCGAATMDSSSVNIHYHGTNVSPTCHQDEVIYTVINSGFTYDLAFPTDEPPGLYWYHPHIQGIAEPAVLGAASGALILDGIEAFQPAVAGLPQRLFVIRDQNVAGQPPPLGPVPSWDLTLNDVPIAYPALTPAVIKMAPIERQFWRVVNASADTILDLQVVYDGTPQKISLIALDGGAGGIAGRHRARQADTSYTPAFAARLADGIHCDRARRERA
jgi:FtsP/CotA-like multicopper oxidase with cupredoxin domain